MSSQKPTVRPRLALLAVAAMLTPAAALAHPGDTLAAGMLAGLAHPWTGLDHIAAMVAAGLWSVHTASRATPRFLLATAVGIVAGAWVGAYWDVFTLAETITAASAVTLGLFAAVATRTRVSPAAMLVALFCFFHGYVHAAETPNQFSHAAFTAGFLTSMLTLQVLGAMIAVAAAKRVALMRWTAACCAVAGLSTLLVS